MIEYADNILVAEDELCDPKMERLHTLMSDIFVYVNDLFSFEKEIIQHSGRLDKTFNLVALISRLEECDIGLAMQRLADMIRETERQIKKLEKELVDDRNCSDVRKTLIGRMNYFVGGNHKVSTVLDRYN